MATAAAGVAVDLLNPSLNTGDAKGDSYVAIRRVVGSSFADEITADNSGDALNGGAGDDTIVGGGVDFHLWWHGRDTLTGGAGRRSIHLRSRKRGRRRHHRLLRDARRSDRDIPQRVRRRAAE